MYKVKLLEICRESSFPVVDFGQEHFVVTQRVIGDLRVLSYFEQWKKAVENKWYHVRMADHSIFLFSEGTKPSYSFLHCPLRLPTFADFLESIGQRNVPRARLEFQDQYDQLVDTASLREHVTPIRFDYDAASYRSGAHPAAHVHIGLDNQVRLATNKMSAVSFVLFVMRQMYPHCWEKLLSRRKRDQFARPIRDPSTVLPPDVWTEIDRIEHYLN